MTAQFANNDKAMNTKALRQKILDLAIHGKLVPQDPNDEPASVLLERIKAEKERLIKEGKIKRAKRSKAACDKPHYENVPFEVPGSWVWTTLGEISNYGTTINIQVEDIGKNEWILELEDIEKETANIIQRLSASERSVKGTRHKFNAGSILYSKLRTYLNKVLVAPSNGYCTTEIMPFDTYGIISNEYICHVLRSPFFLDYTLQCGYGVKMPRLSTTDACNGMIPLPPLKEQIRIVETIKHWFVMIDIIESGKDNLHNSIGQTKSKILDLAIHGKLVPQDPTDEPACELLKRINPKAEIACDNAQYGKLPKGWCLLPLLSLCDCYQPKTISMSQLDENGAYPVYGANGVIGRYNQYNHREQEILLTCRGATCGEVNKSESYSWINGNAMVLHPLFGINKDFIYYLAHTFKKHDGLISGTAQPQITRINLGKLFIGLPPLNEQHRIVAKIEELFVQLDNIALSL